MNVSGGAAAGYPPLDDVLLARRVNQVLGGPFVAPWDVGQLPEEFIDIVEGLVEDLPGYAAARAMTDKRAETWRQGLRVH